MGWDGKKLSIVWKKPFNLVAERAFSNGDGVDREQWKTILGYIYEYFLKNNLFQPLDYLCMISH
ncbi:MAG: hypothetical protein HYX20_02075 [Candidatus Yanofskybacteria bacterium]|nr:hypothetical protein [Candidatus Yanofskybacteria bacterium]